MCEETQAWRAVSTLYVLMYYSFDNRPLWFRALWRISDRVRRVISGLPFSVRHGITEIIAATVYYPLARTARVMEKLGADVSCFPLSAYRSRSFYCMRTDALDRFGTRLEKRYSAREIREMMQRAGLENIRFNDSMPYWCAVGLKRK